MPEKELKYEAKYTVKHRPNCSTFHSGVPHYENNERKSRCIYHDECKNYDANICRKIEAVKDKEKEKV